MICEGKEKININMRFNKYIRAFYFHMIFYCHVPSYLSLSLIFVLICIIIIPWVSTQEQLLIRVPNNNNCKNVKCTYEEININKHMNKYFIFIFWRKSDITLKLGSSVTCIAFTVNLGMLELSLRGYPVPNITQLELE